MKPSMLYAALHALIAERVPVHIWGAPGVGKSQIARRVADDLGFEFLDVRALQLDPVDFRGLPRIAENATEWVPPKFLPTAGKGILFLDELTSAPQMTQAACYQLVLDRKLGEYSAGRLGGDRRRQSGVGTWRAFLDAPPSPQPFCTPSP
jgi:MoxR-like ATPase